jgi:hypothetical protein
VRLDIVSHHLRRDVQDLPGGYTEVAEHASAAAQLTAMQATKHTPAQGLRALPPAGAELANTVEDFGHDCAV